MYQLVNMYQPVFRRQPKLLSTTTLATIVAIVTVLMLAVYLDARSTMLGLRRTSANLALNHAQLDARLGEIASVAASSTTDVDDDVAALQARIADRNALLHRIDDLFVDANGSFGDVFETLARASLPGLWLTEVQLDEDGSIEISGVSSDPTLVPRYLQLITREPSLARLAAGTVDVEREGDDAAEVNFVLSYAARGVGH